MYQGLKVALCLCSDVVSTDVSGTRNVRVCLCSDMMPTKFNVLGTQSVPVWLCSDMIDRYRYLIFFNA